MSRVVYFLIVGQIGRGVLLSWVEQDSSFYVRFQLSNYTGQMGEVDSPTLLFVMF